jgi:hypothetical protein
MSVEDLGKFSATKPETRVRRRWLVSKHGRVGGATVLALPHRNVDPGRLSLEIPPARALEPAKVSADDGRQLSDPGHSR